MQSTDPPYSVKTNSEKYVKAAEHPDALLRIIRNVAYEGDCWIWQRYRNNRGYATMRCNKQDVFVHRLTHWIVVGPIPDGLVLDHLCRTPACVNPLHTEVVTQLVNTQRGEVAQRTHCPKGHPYDDQNTRRHTDKKGHTRRQCIACVNARNARRSLAY